MYGNKEISGFLLETVEGREAGGPGLIDEREVGIIPELTS